MLYEAVFFKMVLKKIGGHYVLLSCLLIAYRGDFKNYTSISLCDIQSYHPLRLLYSCTFNNINYKREAIGQFKIKRTIKNEKDFGIATRTNESKNNYDVCTTEHFLN